MLLIDAIYINNGGGKVLLDYLIEEMEKTNIQIFYLLDDRIKDLYHIKPTNKILYQSSSLKLRYIFYKRHGCEFKKIFVLGNIPPLSKVKDAIVYTYFHNTIYLSVPKDFSFVEKVKYFFKSSIIRYASRNTNFWLFQSDSFMRKFEKKFCEINKIIVLPFYPSLKINESPIVREKNTFFYVSNAQSNKNHIRLIKAFCKNYDQTKKGKLILTVNKSFPNVISVINEVIDAGYPVENIGFVDRETLSRKYLESEFIIFPSLTESFGLGLIEGVESGCKVVGADLPYTYSVCVPSLVFDAQDEDSIARAIIFATKNEVKNSDLKVENKIKEIVTLLS